LKRPSPLPLVGLLAATIAIGPSCGSSTDPFTTGSGRASVTGHVTDHLGASVSGTTVRISCAGASAVTAPTDTLGVYAANLSLSEAAFDETDGRPSCRFSEPAEGVALVQLDTVLNFAQGPVLVTLQRVNLERP